MRDGFFVPSNVSSEMSMFLTFLLSQSIIQLNESVCQEEKEHMRKARINLYITERQKRQLEKRSREEHLPEAEIIRRALDAYLAWDDPTYSPLPKPQERNVHSSPG